MQGEKLCLCLLYMGRGTPVIIFIKPKVKSNRCLAVSCPIDTLSFIKGFPQQSSSRRVWTRFPLTDPSFPTSPALDWSSTNLHAPSPGHVNPGCRPRGPRRLSMEYQSTWFQACWLWVWPRFEPLTPSPQTNKLLYLMQLKSFPSSSKCVGTTSL